jgi:ubiquitin-conjugating enzyme E2 J2
MASIIQKKRLANEVKLLSQQPLHYCTAYPDETNPLIWYFLLKGQKGTDYHTGEEDGGGEYIGKIVHSPKYPAEPPDYYMLTPSGRYTVGSKICLTNSSYHKGDWSSTWNILSILIAFYSIWLDDKEHGISHITDSTANRKKMAKESIEYNLKNNSSIYSKFDRTFLKDDAPSKKNIIENNCNQDSSNQIQNDIQNNNNIQNDIQNDIQNKIVVENELNEIQDIEQEDNTKKIIIETDNNNDNKIVKKKVKRTTKKV